jgi:steroid 5-alpha reductase family enzyme
MLAFGFAGWVYSNLKSNVTIVDSLWGLFFLLGALFYLGDTLSFRAALVVVLVAIWSLRLSIYLTMRNSDTHEDRRYQQIRRKNEPFWIKSIYIVFGLQAILAWIISLPLHGAITSLREIGTLDLLGVILWSIGFYFEVVGDLQLQRFKQDPENAGKALSKGLWRYTRHPNYFGECCIWWGYYLIAASSGAWWSFPAPLLVTFLLLKVSGVVMLERDIVERRPEYADYIRRTNSFFPWFPKN